MEIRKALRFRRMGRLLSKFILLLLLLAMSLTEGAPIASHYNKESFAEDRTSYIHSFMRKMHKLLALIQFTLQNNLGMS
ncbi:Uncharacterized protein APZ42_021826 [Daphnia magna]|uniref:Uncharacterized protein n=1 Tax=Daphnia magna TaxID=35525 RepID=A0A164W9Y1_9CRUS|nr:Uncharacterized protein APZ42_021826 [Daphnia magna]